MQSIEPVDKHGNAIETGQLLIARRANGEELHYRVLDVDQQQARPVHVQCLNPIVEERATHWISRLWLARMYEVEG